MTAKTKLGLGIVSLLGLNGASLAAIEGYSFGNWFEDITWDSASKSLNLFGSSQVPKTVETEDQTEASGSQKSQSHSYKPRTLTFSTSPARSLDPTSLTTGTPNLGASKLDLQLERQLDLNLNKLTIGEEGLSRNEAGTSSSLQVLRQISSENKRMEQVDKIEKVKDVQAQQILDGLKEISMDDYRSVVSKVEKFFGKTQEGNYQALRDSKGEEVLEEGLSVKERVALRTVYAVYDRLMRHRLKVSKDLRKVAEGTRELNHDLPPAHKQLVYALNSIGWGYNRIVTLNGRNPNPSNNWGWGTGDTWKNSWWGKLCSSVCGGEQGFKSLLEKRKERLTKVFEQANAETHRRWMTEWCWSRNCYRRTPEQLDKLYSKANAEIELTVAKQLLYWMKQFNVPELELHKR